MAGLGSVGEVRGSKDRTSAPVNRPLADHPRVDRPDSVASPPVLGP